MELEIVLDAPTAKEYGIKVLCDEEGNKGLTISSGKGSKTLNVGYIEPPFELQEGEDLTLRIFIDKNMIEVFANDRQAALAWHDYDPQDLHVSLFSKGGDLKVKSVPLADEVDLPKVGNRVKGERAMNVTKNILTTLLLTLLTSACSAREAKTVIDTPAMPENPPETWLTYHLAHPEAEETATAGDPNPAFFWKGRYHLHYIYKHQDGSVSLMFPVTTWCTGSGIPPYWGQQPWGTACGAERVSSPRTGGPPWSILAINRSETGFPMPWTTSSTNGASRMKCCRMTRMASP